MILSFRRSEPERDKNLSDLLMYFFSKESDGVIKGTSSPKSSGY